MSNQEIMNKLNTPNSGDEQNTLIEHRQEFFQGPLPHPELLNRYNRVLPGLADRITKMAEKQASHRHKMEKRISFFDGLNMIFGQICAFLIIIAGFFTSAFLVMNGKPISGFISLITPLGIVAGAFMYERKKTKKESK